MKLNSIKSLMIISVSVILVLVLYIIFVLSPSYTRLLVDMIEGIVITDGRGVIERINPVLSNLFQTHFIYDTPHTF